MPPSPSPAASTPRPGSGPPWRPIALALAAGLLIPALAVASVGWWFLRDLDLNPALSEPGAESAEFAAVTWLYALRSDVGPWSGPHVDADAADAVARVRAEVIRPLRAHRATLEAGAAPAGQDGRSGGEVVEWWYVQAGADGTVRPWRFSTVARDGLWWITVVHPPPMCGRTGYFPSCP